MPLDFPGFGGFLTELFFQIFNHRFGGEVIKASASHSVHFRKFPSLSYMKDLNNGVHRSSVQLSAKVALLKMEYKL